ncbi:MAG: type II toxin-antitoxin system RelE/ParE family toxin [Gammaproteobacteria bacterium]|nr:type II toxin-antitoxin system RelE/ParE family toxin [Gammaproteobacteria bacterium]
MIKSFRHKGLARFFNEGEAGGIAPSLAARVGVRLRTLHAATRPEDLNIPGFDFHALKGKPKRYSVHLNGPFCVTFEWVDGAAWRVDLQNYH